MKKFRIPFYRQLANELDRRNITLNVVFSHPSGSEVTKNDASDLMPPVGVKVRAFHPFGGRAMVQALPFRLLAEADLVITVQANRYLMNYVLLLLNSLKAKRVAFWGHAFNHQGRATSLRERFKKHVATRVDWWFTYTSHTAAYLIGIGYPAERISVIQNAVDTRGFGTEVAKCKLDGAAALRRSLSNREDPFIALYCGSLYADKELNFLLEAADMLATRHSNFRLVIVGDGPDSGYVREAASARHWLKYVGPQFGLEKARLFAASDVFLNPGLVGLAILDSFAAGLPFITTERVGHSPEIAYLQQNENGVVLPFVAQEFVAGIEELMANAELLAKLRRGAAASAARLTLENMVGNVVEGICRSLRCGS